METFREFLDSRADEPRIGRLVRVLRRLDPGDWHPQKALITKLYTFSFDGLALPAALCYYWQRHSGELLDLSLLLPTPEELAALMPKGPRERKFKPKTVPPVVIKIREAGAPYIGVVRKRKEFYAVLKLAGRKQMKQGPFDDDASAASCYDSMLRTLSPRNGRLFNFAPEKSTVFTLQEAA